MTKPLTLMVTSRIEASPEKAFDYIVPVNLSHIFRRLLFIPGVSGTNEKSHWSTAGLSRTVFFTDTSSAREELLAVERPLEFSYKISDFTGFNKLFIDFIIGHWVFTHDKKHTYIAWSYTLYCHNSFSKLCMVFCKPMLTRYLKRALQTLKLDLEQNK